MELVEHVVEYESCCRGFLGIDFVNDLLFQEVPADLAEEVLDIQTALFLEVFDFGANPQLD